jgi:putative ABC transport system permease protein
MLLHAVRLHACRPLFAAAAIAAGLLAAWLVARTLGPLLFGVTASEPGVYVAVALLLGGLSCIAAWMPAMRVARVDPSELLWP